MTSLAERTSARGVRTKSSGGLSIGRPSFVWSLPAITYFAIFAIVPLGVVVWLSFTSWDALGSPTWVGADNWRSLFHDATLINSFKVTAILTALGIVTQTPVSLLLGVWAAGHERNRAVLSAIYFIPLLMSATAISIVWLSLLNPYFGLPHELHWLFGNSLFGHGYLFSYPAQAIGVLTFVGMWQWTPFHTLIYQGGARAIPAVLYQAAAVDGAGRVRQFFYITLPQLRNTIITSVVLMLVGSVTSFDTILILTSGRPGISTTSTSYYMYIKGFQQFEFGQASVIGVLLVVVTTLISLIVVRLSGWDKMRSTQEGM
jgi:xylobiose transport system permease protein